MIMIETSEYVNDSGVRTRSDYLQGSRGANVGTLVALDDSKGR